MQVNNIHAILIIPSKYSVSEVIGLIKRRSANMLRKKLALLERLYWKERIVWSLGYFV